MTWFAENGVGELVRFEVTEKINSSMVTVNHESFVFSGKGTESFHGHIEGWTKYLCNLRCYLEVGFDLRSDQPVRSIAM